MLKQSVIKSRSIPVLALTLLSLSTALAAVEDRAKAACEIPKPAEETYLDYSHSYLTAWFCEPALWFDDFFVDEHIYEENHPGTVFSWKNDLILSEGGSFDHITTVRASFKLPKASRKLKLIFESEDQESINDVIPTSTDDAETSLSLLYDFIDSEKSDLSLRVSLSPKATLRYRYTNQHDDDLITRFTQNLYREEGYYGAQSQFFIDKALDEDDAFRWLNQVEIIEDVDGYRWLSGLALYHRLDEKSAFSYEFSTEGESQPIALTTNIRFGVRYRKNFYRKWMFYELAPEVTWPRELVSDTRHSVFALVFRLEIFFTSVK